MLTKTSEVLKTSEVWVRECLIRACSYPPPSRFTSSPIKTLQYRHNSPDFRSTSLILRQ
jgi:hypothetical protein